MLGSRDYVMAPTGLILPGKVAADRDRARAARKPKAMDFFAGAGGMSLGLIQAGYEVVGRMTRAFDDYDFDSRQRAAEEVHEDAMHAATVFACQGCGEEHDIVDRVVLRAHPEMPAFCWICACNPGPGRRTYP